MEGIRQKRGRESIQLCAGLLGFPAQEIDENEGEGQPRVLGAVRLQGLEDLERFPKRSPLGQGQCLLDPRSIGIGEVRFDEFTDAAFRLDPDKSLDNPTSVSASITTRPGPRTAKKVLQRNHEPREAGVSGDINILSRS